MTDWWSNDPIASAPAAPVPVQPAGNWWDADPVAVPASPKVAVDPLQAEVRRDLDKSYAAGMPKPGFARQFVQGATLNTADEILAALDTPVQMILKGKSIGDAYRYAKARENMGLEDAQKDSPVTGALGQVLGGVLTGGGLMKAGATAIPAAVSRLGTVAGTAAGGAIDGAALGAVSGFADGDSLQSRLEETARGASIGGAVGGALPLAAAAIKPLAAPIVSNVAARVNPAGYAERQVARAAARSGQTGDQIADRLGLAASEGQGEYRLLDALDYPGARLGAVVAKNPGEGRTQLRSFLNERQEGQGYRLSNALSEGLDAPVTAQRATANLTAARNTAADSAYGQARADADLVDTSGALARIQETLSPEARGITQVGEEVGRVSPDSIEAILGRAESLLASADTRKLGFEGVQRVKGDLDDAVGKAVRAGENNKARLLGQVTRELDAALEAASPSYASARNAYRQGSRNIEAVETGRAAAGRGRSEDKIAAFGGLAPTEQAAFRTGYADPLIARIQGAAEGANKARPFTSQAMRAELPAFAAEGRADGLMRQIGRENEMFANRAEALGNSKTAENLADNADAGVDAGMFAKLLTGQFGGALKDALTRGAAGVNGNTEAVRQNLAKLLMTGSPDEVRALLQRLARESAGRGELGAGLYRGLLSGGLPTVNSLIGERGRRPILPAARTAR